MGLGVSKAVHSSDPRQLWHWGPERSLQTRKPRTFQIEVTEHAASEPHWRFLRRHASQVRLPHETVFSCLWFHLVSSWSVFRSLSNIIVLINEPAMLRQTPGAVRRMKTEFHEVFWDCVGCTHSICVVFVPLWGALDHLSGLCIWYSTEAVCFINRLLKCIVKTHCVTSYFVFK